MDFFSLHGIHIPRLGLGTYGLSGKPGQAAIEHALSIGYRHLDTAEMYENETEVGGAIAQAGVERDQLHVTTKVWRDHLQPAAVRRALDASLRRLKLDYVDLYLVHWPSPDMPLGPLFETLMALKEQGLTRAIGVCNFNIDLLTVVIEHIQAPIACNQVEYHVFLDQTRLCAYLRRFNIPLIAYSPLAQGAVEADPVLQAIGAKHGASAAQVALRWLLAQEGVGAIPKARSPASQQANLLALQLELNDEDRAQIDALPKDRRRIDPGFAPRWD